MDSYAFANPKHLKIWLWLLMKANYKNTFALVSTGRGEMTIEVKRGQLIFGRFKAEEELEIEATFIRRTLQKFEELGQIKLEMHSHFTLITICKYESYQGQESESAQALLKQRPSNDQQLPNTCPTSAQQVPTSKEGLEYKEGKEILEIGDTEKIVIRSIRPLPTDFNGLPDQYIESAKRQVSTTKKIMLENSQISELWEAFKLQHLNGETFYNSDHDVYKHFVNWFKSQKFENKTQNNGTKSRSQRQSEGIQYLLQKGREEYAKVMATNQQGKTD